MKRDKRISRKIFILPEVLLAAMVVVVIAFMIHGRNEKIPDKISVIIQNSNDNQWASFKYGLKMAAEDYQVEMFVVGTNGRINAQEEKRLIEAEIGNGADAVIVQPVSDPETEEMLRKIKKKVPVMLVDQLAGENGESLDFPVTEPDNYAMGVTLAEELLRDYSGKLEGKNLGLLAGADKSYALAERKRGFQETIENSGADISWSVSDAFEESGKETLKIQAKVDLVIAFDDDSLTAAGECSAANDLKGALVYGIGHSTEAAYYLDTGIVQCLIVPDEFNAGYQSLAALSENLGNVFHEVQDKTVSFTVIRKDTLFTKENQEILFTMS